MNIPEANYQTLLKTYFENETVASVREQLLDLIRQGDQRKLGTLLRDHRSRSVKSKREIDFRSAVDALLNGYSALEIALTAVFIPPPDQSAFWEQTALLLDHPAVQRYYGEYYSLILPQLLHRRLQNPDQRLDSQDQDFSSPLLQFLHLDQRFNETFHDSYLLKMLDSFSIDGFRFPDVVRAISDPRDFVERVLLPPDQQGVLDIALVQFGDFLRFCFELHGLLNRLVDAPALQTRIWGHYGYWFGKMGSRLKSSLGTALDGLNEWESSGDDPQSGTEIVEFVARSRQVLDELCAESYQLSLLRLAQ